MSKFREFIFSINHVRKKDLGEMRGMRGMREEREM